MSKNNPALMMVATIGTFILLVLLIFFPIPDKNAQTFLALATFMLGFYFGSCLNKSAQPTPPPAGEIPDPNDVAALAALQAAVSQAAGTLKGA